MVPEYQVGDLIKFYPYRAPVPGIPDIGLVIESRIMTHEERNYKYEVVRVKFGDREFTLPAVDFKLVKRV